MVAADDDVHTVVCSDEEQKKVAVEDVRNVRNYKGSEKIVVVARFAVVYARMKDEIGVVDIKNDVKGRYYYCAKRKKENNSGSKNSRRTKEVV